MSDKKNIFEESSGRIPLLSLQNNFKDHQALLTHWIREDQGPLISPMRKPTPIESSKSIFKLPQSRFVPNRSTIGSNPLTTVENQKCHYLRTRSFPTHWKTAGYQNATGILRKSTNKSRFKEMWLRNSRTIKNLWTTSPNTDSIDHLTIIIRF